MSQIEFANEGNDESNKKDKSSSSSDKDNYSKKSSSYQSLNDNEPNDKPLTEAFNIEGNPSLKLENKDTDISNIKKTDDIDIGFKKGCIKKLKDNKLSIFLMIIILLLIALIIKFFFHYIRKRNKSWLVIGGIVSQLLNERAENNKRLFLYKEDIIEQNNTKNLIHVCLTFDENFIYPALVLMTSLLENNNKNNNLVVLHLLLPDNFNEAKFEVIETLKKKYEVKINYYIIPNFFNSLKKWRENTYTIYFKMIIPIMFSDLDRIIFLDADTLVFKDLLEMYNLPLNDNYVLGFPSHDAKYISLLIDEVKIYINVGILLINIKKIREDNKDIELLEYMFDKTEILTFPEQDAMNVVFYGKIGMLPLKYGILLYDIDVYDNKLKSRINVKIDRDEMKNAIEDPSIIHFSLCNPKVWYPSSKNYYGKNYICKKYYNIFYYYANKTEFYYDIYKKYHY